MTQEIWKRLPDETPKAYAAFVKYRSLDLNGEGLSKRNLENTAALLGLKATSGVEKWSAKFNWIERAAAWDDKRESEIIKVVDVNLASYRQAVTNDLMLQLITLDKLVNNEIKAAVEEQLIGERVSPVALKRLVEVTTMLDNLKRRAAGMPTAYTRETVSDDADTLDFTIGEMDD